MIFKIRVSIKFLWAKVWYFENWNCKLTNKLELEGQKLADEKKVFKIHQHLKQNILNWLIES